MKNITGALALAIACAACGSSSSGNGTATGTVGGNTLAVADAIFASGSLNGSYMTEILLTSFSGACADVQSQNSSVTGDALSLYISSSSGSLATGTYTMASGMSAGFATSSNYTASATGGTVTISSASASTVQGTYSLQFNSSDTLSGNFSAGLCAPK